MHDFEVSLLWVSKCEYPARHVVKTHSHCYYQVIFVLNGDGTIVIDDSSYEAKINRLFVVKPFVNHGIFAAPYRSLNTVEYKLQCGNEYTCQLLEKLDCSIENTSQTVRNVFVSIIEELKNVDSYYEEMLKLHFQQLVYYLLRNGGARKLSGENPTIEVDNEMVQHERFKPVLIAANYIRENYQSEISLSDLAGIVHLNPAYLCSLFKESYGMTPINFLQNMRLQKAKMLLVESDRTVTDVAFHVGFQSVHYFSRIFKCHEGISPVDFRRRNRGYIYKDFAGNMTEF